MYADLWWERGGKIFWGTERIPSELDSHNSRSICSLWVSVFKNSFFYYELHLIFISFIVLIIDLSFPLHFFLWIFDKWLDNFHVKLTLISTFWIYTLIHVCSSLSGFLSFHIKLIMVWINCQETTQFIPEGSINVISIFMVLVAKWESYVRYKNLPGSVKWYKLHMEFYEIIG